MKDFLKTPEAIAISSLGIISLLVYLLIPHDSPEFDTISYVLYLGISLLGVAVIYMTYRFYGRKSFEGKVWFMIFLGILLWILGEFIWMYYDLVLKTDAFPSLADVAYLIAYIPVTWAFVYKAKYAKIDFDFKKAALIAGIMLIIVLPTVFFVAIPIISDSGAVYSNGEPLTGEYFYEFNTVENGSIPESWVVDRDGLENVALNATIVFRLPENADKKSVEENIWVVDEDGNEVNGEIYWNGSTAIFVPEKDLEPGKTYEAEIYLGYGLIEKIVSLMYPLLDFILLGIALYVAFQLGPAVSKGWYIISAAMIFMAVADIMFSFMEWSGNVSDNLDLLWIASYLLFALGALYQKKYHEDLMEMD